MGCGLSLDLKLHFSVTYVMGSFSCLWAACVASFVKGMFTGLYVSGTVCPFLTDL